VYIREQMYIIAHSFFISHFHKKTTLLTYKQFTHSRAIRFIKWFSVTVKSLKFVEQ